MENNNNILIDIYCPTKDHMNGQNHYLENISPHKENFRDKNIILAADPNTYLDPTIDKLLSKNTKINLPIQNKSIISVRNTCLLYMEDS